MLSWVFNNWQLKLLSLVIAVLMWVFVGAQEQAEVTVKLPVELTNVPEDLVVTGEVASEISVRLSGPSVLIRRMQTRNLVQTVDLAGMKAGEHVVGFAPDRLGLPPGIRIIRVSPANFTLNLSRKAQKEVPVSWVRKGDPAPGYEVSEVTFEPPMVMVSGSEEAVKDLDWIWTVPIDISGLNKDANLKVQLRIPGERTLRLGRERVEAHIRIKPRLGSRPERPSPPSKEAPAAPAETGSENL